MSPDITFEKGQTEFILDTFNKTVDDEGYIIEQDTERRVLKPNGEPMLLEEFGGIEKGSEIFIEDNFATLVEKIGKR